jgi:hypothetical protein
MARTIARNWSSMAARIDPAFARTVSEANLPPSTLQFSEFAAHTHKKRDRP